MIKGREPKGVQSADLLVCFPTRAHLTLMPPKPTCSPARPSDQHQPNKRHHQSSRHTRKKSMSSLGIVSTNGGGQAAAGSPLLWAKNKQINGGDLSEPTSPKVTCAGQIKVRHKAAAATCKSWQSVMEEIERIHNDRRTKKIRPTSWMESVGFKKEVLHFLTCLKNIRLDFRCFGAFPQADVTSDDDEEDAELEEEEEEEDDHHHQGHANGGGESDQGSRTAFSKWFMVLQENNQSKVYCKEENNKEVVKEERSCLVGEGDDDHEVDRSLAVPPPNALLLMRCRSAPAKSWLEEKLEEERHQREGQELKDGEDDHQETGRTEEENCDKKVDVVKRGKSLKNLMEEEERKDKKESLVVMRYDTGLYKISTDIAKETWVVGGMRDPLSRSRSWKR